MVLSYEVQELRGDGFRGHLSEYPGAWERTYHDVFDIVLDDVNRSTGRARGKRRLK
jgi:hypothetical protein